MSIVVPPLRLGPLLVSPPVVLAPMAGVTNPPFRRLCRRYGAGLYVSEMVQARGLVEGGSRSWELARFDPDESPRSIQLYGTDPGAVAEAVALLVERDHVDHVDLNVGCPVRKVTRHGGGAALPLRRELFRRVVRAAVDAGAPGGVPVTVKMRTGLDHDHLSYRSAGAAAADEGAAAVALHARTAAQLYSGSADWAAIATLVDDLAPLPVLGNGDIWAADDAAAMVRRTGCAGVVIGRGCLGRPWLFGDLAAVFAGGAATPPPALGDVIAVLIEHAHLLVDHLGEARGIRDLRKHIGWYLTGYPVGPTARRTLTLAPDLAALEAGLAQLDPTIGALPGTDRRPRGTLRGPQQVTLPEGWLELVDDPTPPGYEAELVASGG